MAKHNVLSLSLLLIGLLTANLNVHANEPVSSDQGMVVSEQKLASQIGIDILKAGGNAVDAAVAVGYALAVVNPCCGNLGGGGFMTLHLATGKDIFINFRERAPFAARTNMYLNVDGKIIPGKSTVGYLAVAVPGTVLGLETALKEYGTMTREQVMAPAIKLAEQGYVLTAGDVKFFDMFTKEFKNSPDIAAIYLKDGQPYQAGDLLVQKDLAKSLKLIATDGPKAFYDGPIAQEIVDASETHGGILRMQDFAKYRVEILNPVQCNYRGFTIISAPPPSSGGTTICEILNVLEAYPLAKMGYQSVQSVHFITEAMRFGFYDRNNKLGDPDYINNPVAQLTAKKYAEHIRKKIKINSATPSDAVTTATAHEGVNTTHYSVIDKAGNAASVTYTLNTYFGALVIAPGSGFFLNNEMDDFTSSPNQPNQFGLMQGENNKIEPGKRPLSAMAPTIILNQNLQPMLIVGSPGGPRIISATLLTILNVIDFGMNIQDAVDARRFHHQWLPDVIEIEPNTFSVDTMHQLNQMGYSFRMVNPFGAVEAIYIDPKTHKIYGGSDTRRSAGLAAGY